MANASRPTIAIETTIETITVAVIAMMADTDINNAIDGAMIVTITMADTIAMTADTILEATTLEANVAGMGVTVTKYDTVFLHRLTGLCRWQSGFVF